MMTKPRPTLFTSLPPISSRVAAGAEYGLDYQIGCVRSWKAAGFNVVSINPAPEIEQLKKHRFPVTYLASDNPRPKIYEFINAALRSESELVGITNADCFFLGYPEFVRNILRRSREGLVMIERVNIDPVDLIPTGQTCLGFDCFFFSKSHAAQISIDDELSVGQPWWDYWFPLEFARSGIKRFRPRSPFVVHLDHKQGWSQARYLHFGRKLMRHFADNKGPAPVAASLQNFSVEEKDLEGFAYWCFNWLRDTAELVPLAREPGFGALFSRFLTALTNYDGMHEATLLLVEARREVHAVPLNNLYARYLELLIRARRKRSLAVDKYVRYLQRENKRLREGQKSAEARARKAERALRQAKTETVGDQVAEPEAVFDSLSVGKPLDR